jgi:MerR family transcriptional regulator, light-induced transcriptional regulator
MACPGQMLDARIYNRNMADKKKAETVYPIRAAARLTRLSIDTLRAWEKRYAVVRPLRRKGVRLYSDADVERLSLLREALDHGHSIGQISGLSNKDLAALSVRTAPSRLSAGDEAPLDTILGAIERFDYAAAHNELGRLASLIPARDLIHRIALPLMRVAGDRWHEQRLRVAQEHLLSQLLTALLGGLMRIYAPGDPPALLMTATLSDDHHEFGILAAAMLASGAGLGVIHLGSNLPLKEIAYAAKKSGADVVLLSITNPQDHTLREQQLRSLRAGLANPIEIWAGVNPASTDFQVKGVRLLRDFRDLEQELQRIGGRF